MKESFLVLAYQENDNIVKEKKPQLKLKKHLVQGSCYSSSYAEPTILLFSSVQFSSVQDGIYALGKAHMRSTPSLGSFPNVALETVSMLV